ncbi:MAG TPA: TetR/AcrR family transcriptional regulator [Planctomycetes bacterium]|nr:TetR/AcrR family transcriptional regulator [Planctomycetota bacterium]
MPTPSTPRSDRSSSSTTKEKILDAAEELFSELGYDATSLRAVTKTAGVNLAAVNYHCGSKLGLFRAIFERRIGPLNRERLAALERARERVGEGKVIPLGEVLRAFFEAPVRMAAREDPGFRRFLRIAGRMQSASGDHANALVPVFAEVREHFHAALRAALPHLDDRDFSWRLHLLIGAMCTLFADPQRIAILSQGHCDPENPDEVLAQLIAFGKGALGAPSKEPLDEDGAAEGPA